MSGRIRTIKPDFFKHEGLFDAERETGLPLRLAFSGLWTQCDRDGRFHWRPRQLKTDILPYDDVDFSRVLHALTTRGFLVRYASQGELFGCIPSWHRHQIINNREKASDLPQPSDQAIAEANELDASATRQPRVDDATLPLLSGREGKGKEGNGKGKEEKKDAASAAPGHENGKAEVTAEAALFFRGKQVLGSTAGGQIRKLLSVKDGNVSLARAAIEMASTKQDPGEYIGAIVRHPKTEAEMTAAERKEFQKKKDWEGII